MWRRMFALGGALVRHKQWPCDIISPSRIRPASVQQYVRLYSKRDDGSHEVDGSENPIEIAFDSIIKQYPSVLEDPEQLLEVLREDDMAAKLLLEAAKKAKTSLPQDIEAAARRMTVTEQLVMSGLAKKDAVNIHKLLQEDKLTVDELLASLSEEEAARFLAKSFENADPRRVRDIFAAAQKEDHDDDADDDGSGDVDDDAIGGGDDDGGGVLLDGPVQAGDEDDDLYRQFGDVSVFIDDPQILRRRRTPATVQADEVVSKIEFVETGEIPFSLGALPDRKAKVKDQWQQTARHKRATDKLERVVYRFLFREALRNTFSPESFQIHQAILNPSRSKFTIYWYSLDKSLRGEFHAALMRSVPKIKAEIARSVSMKKVPKIEFKWTNEHFADEEIDLLFEQLRNRDPEKI